MEGGDGSGNGDGDDDGSNLQELASAAQPAPAPTPEESPIETPEESRQGDTRELYIIEISNDQIIYNGVETSFEELQKQLMNLDSSEYIFELRSNNHIKATFDNVEALLNEYSFYFNITYAETLP